MGILLKVVSFQGLNLASFLLHRLHLILQEPWSQQLNQKIETFHNLNLMDIKILFGSQDKFHCYDLTALCKSEL